MKFQIEHTDTFGGESNYSWVRRHNGESGKDSDLSVIRAAKKILGWQGIKCRVDNYGDNLAIYPAGICQVAFIDFPESGAYL